ncbi:MAG: tetratricopeptide repeat protein [Gemmatimonadaceae bacterium]
MTDGRRAWWTAHPFALRAALVAAVALAASATSLTNGFAYDDVLIIETNPAVHDLRAPWAYFGETYWGPTRGTTALYRPLAILGYAVQWAIGDGSPLVFHAVNVLLYAAAAVVAFVLLSRLLSPVAALVGGVIFAAHPVHVEAVGNVVGQAELWVALGVLAALALYARARQTGPLTIGTGALIAGCFTAALFFKEHGIVLPALILALEWFGRATTFFFVRQEGDWRRARTLALALGLIAALYVALRVAVLGEVTGTSPAWGLLGLSAGGRARVMLALAPEFARLLFWPARLYADYSPRLIAVVPDWSTAHLPGAALVAVTLAAAMAARRRAPIASFAVVWFACTIALVSNLLFASGVLIAERTLFLPSLAVSMVLGPLIAWPLTRWRGAALTAVRTTASALLLLAVVHSAVRQRMWEDNATLFGTLVAEAPANFRGHFAVGEMYSRGGRYDDGEAAFQRSLALHPEFGPARLAHARILHFRGLCREALPEYERVLAGDPTVGLALIGRTACLVDLRRLHDARRSALDGLFVEGMEPAFQAIRRATDSLLVATDSADARNRWWREGRPFDRTGLQPRVWVILDFPTLHDAAGRMQHARPSAATSTATDR